MQRLIYRLALILFFWRCSENVFSTFPQECFFRDAGILSTLLFLWLMKTALWTLSYIWGINWSMQQQTMVEEDTCLKVDTNTVLWRGRTTQTGSIGGWPCGSSKRKDLCYSPAVQCGQAKEFIGSGPTKCKEEWGWEILINSLSDS